MTWKSPLSAKFSAISRPYFHLPLLGFRRGEHLVAGVGTFWSLVLQVGSLTCHWQGHSVKTFLLSILNDSWAGQKPTRVAVPIEEEEDYLNLKRKFRDYKVHSQESEIYHLTVWIMDDYFVWNICGDVIFIFGRTLADKSEILIFSTDFFKNPRI